MVIVLYSFFLLWYYVKDGEEAMAKHKGLSFYKKKKKISANTIREIFSYIFGIVVAVFIAGVIVYSVGITTLVIGVSMEPSLYNGQKIYVNRLAYTLSTPKVGDVIVFLPNGNENSHYYVKRVVAKAGDTVQIIDGRLYVNGAQVEEPDMDKMAESGIAINEIVLANDECFVLGDNRNNSEDSRSANIGPIKNKYILGKAWFHLSSDEDGIGFVK